MHKFFYFYDTITETNWLCDQEEKNTEINENSFNNKIRQIIKDIKTLAMQGQMNIKENHLLNILQKIEHVVTNLHLYLFEDIPEIEPIKKIKLKPLFYLLLNRCQQLKQLISCKETVKTLSYLESLTLEAITLISL